MTQKKTISTVRRAAGRLAMYTLTAAFSLTGTHAFGLPRATGAGALSLFGAVPLEAAAPEEKVTRELFAMDTMITLTAYGPNAEKGLDAAAEEIQRLDALLSTGAETSEVSQINQRQGSDKAEDENAWSLSPDTAALIEKSLSLYAETDGAFDISIYPLMELWGFPSGAYHVPSDEEREAVLSLVGSDQIVYDAEKQLLHLPVSGMEIDFGGIAKGYTSDRLMDVFAKAGVSSALVSLGGNVQALGAKPDGSAWKVAIQNPSPDGPFLGIAEIADEAVITSGGYERFFEENGETWHHILNPETGLPARSGLLSVTIVSRDGTLADGLSTALYVMGAEKAESFWRERADAFDMILYTEDGELLVSSGLKGRFTSEFPTRYIEP